MLPVGLPYHPSVQLEVHHCTGKEWVQSKQRGGEAGPGDGAIVPTMRVKTPSEYICLSHHDCTQLKSK